MTAPLSHDGLSNLLIAIGMFCAVVLACAFIGRRRPLTKEFAIAVAVVAVLVFAIFFRLLPVMGLTINLRWNWWGKVLAIAACLIFVAADRRTRPADVGLRRPEPASVIPGLIGMVLVCVTQWVFVFTVAPGHLHLPPTETLLYQATMPGLHEELFHRAIVTLLIERAIGKGGGFRLAGAQLSLGALASVVWFGLLHGVGVQDGVFAVSLVTVASTSVAGFGLQWIYSRTKSLILPILTHNLINLGLESIG